MSTTQAGGTRCRECGASSYGHPFCRACHERWLAQRDSPERGICLSCGRDCGLSMKRCQRCHDQLKSRLEAEQSAARDRQRRDAEADAEARGAADPRTLGRYATDCACGCAAVVRVHTPRPGRYYAPGHEPEGQR